jgi:hypothetical protein
MKRILCLMGLAFVGIVMLSGEASAQSVCYRWSAFPEERLRLNVKLDSTLSKDLEERNFHHANQTAHSVFGKHVGVCGHDTMAAVTGTVVKATPGAGAPANDGPTGSHMGVRTHSVRVATAIGIFCKEVTMDCSSEEKSATPATWICFSRNEWDVTHLAPSVLTLVDPTVDPLCSFFQDGTFLTIPPATSGASGLQNP